MDQKENGDLCETVAKDEKGGGVPEGYQLRQKTQRILLSVL